MSPPTPRRLPPHPHIDHLKKQAKALLRAYAAGEPEAIERVAQTLPAFAGRSQAEAAVPQLALHDTQSVIAREYGFASWAELRAAVIAHSSKPFSELNMRMLMTLSTAPNFPPEVFEAMREVERSQAASALGELPPTRVPLVAVRDVIVLKPTITPLAIARPVSVAAVQAAWSDSRVIATFSQRVPHDEHVSHDNLHPVGTYAYVHRLIHSPTGILYVVIEALQEVELISLETATSESAVQGPIYAHVRAFDIESDSDDDEVAQLSEGLRERAQSLVKHLPEPDIAAALLDEMDQLELANAVVTGLPRSVADKARFAAEPELVEKLRLAVTWADTLLTDYVGG